MWLTLSNIDVVKVSSVFGIFDVRTFQSCSLPSVRLQVKSRVCSGELTAADSVTQLRLTAPTSTRLIDTQREEGELGGGGKLGGRVEEENVKQNEESLRIKEEGDKNDGWQREPKTKRRQRRGRDRFQISYLPAEGVWVGHQGRLGFHSQRFRGEAGGRGRHTAGTQVIPQLKGLWV